MEKLTSESDKWKKRKIIVIAVEFLAFFGVLFSLMICQITITSLDDLGEGIDTSYLQSSVYEKQVLETFSSLQNFLNMRLNFEKNEKYDPKRKVDIYDYVHSGLITGEENHGPVYYLQDLMSWVKKEGGFSVEFLDRVGVGFEEWYKPVGYDSLNHYSYEKGVNINDLQNTLWEAIYKLREELENYNFYRMEFSEENTNLKYIVLDKNKKQLYANTGLNEKEIKELGSFIIINYEDLKLDTNMLSKEKLFKQLSRTAVEMPSSMMIIIGIDTSFPIDDNFYQWNRRYNIWYPYRDTAAIVGGMFAVLWFGSLLYMLYLIMEKKETVRFFSRKSDEVAIEMTTLFCCTIGGVGILGAYLCYQHLGIHAGILGILIFVVGFANGMFVLWYGNLLRKIKNRTLIKSSATYHVWKIVENLIYNRGITTRTLFWYTCFLLVNIICMISITYLGRLGLIVTVLLNLSVGLNLLKMIIQQNEISKGIEHVIRGDFDYKIDTRKFQPANKSMGNSVNLISESLRHVIDENMKSERMKTELITNVSHDIKTPLTSIINYVDLLKRLNIRDEEALKYLNILDAKSQRLKSLAEDLVEASRISSGTIVLNCMNINLKEMILQLNGEFIERFQERNLELIVQIPDFPIVIMADSMRLYRVLENIYSNAAKYTMPHTRVYVEMNISQNEVLFVMKNVSETPLTLAAEDVTERFIRGDHSRTTEGSGLGLSIAKQLVELHGGEFKVALDGDLFKVLIILKRSKQLL